MEERPVTGSCEQCGRTYALLIPVPGSGNLEFERAANAFGWCVECGQFVGRACCWGGHLRCARCVAARTAAGSDDADGGFAALAAARAAVRELDGAAAAFSPIDDAVAAIDSADIDAAVGAWGEAWIAAAALKLRLDGGREAAAALLAVLPPDETERVLELDGELAAVTASHAARLRGATDAIREAGMRLAGRIDQRLGRRREPATAVPQLAPTHDPVPAIAVAVPLPILVPDRVSVSVAPEPQPPVVTPAPAPAGLVAATTALTKAPAPVRAPPPTAPRAPSIISPSPAVRPVAAPTTTPSPLATHGTPAPSRPPVAGPVPSTAGNGARRRGLGAAALVIVGVVAAGGLVAGAIAPLLTAWGIGSDPARDLPAGMDRSPGEAAASRIGSTPTSAPVSTAGSDTLVPLLVSFDLHPVGPLDPEDLPLTRIIGAPEVAAFPTSFDRSLRLAGDAGVCLDLPEPTVEDAASIAFDLHLGDAGADGRLLFVRGPREDTQAFDLVTARDLDPDAWYRVVVTGQDAGRIAVTPLGGDQPVLEATLDAVGTIGPTSGREACVQSMLSSDEAVLHVDNLRIER